jgi:hypothetical protein
VKQMDVREKVTGGKDSVEARMRGKLYFSLIHDLASPLGRDARRRLKVFLVAPEPLTGLLEEYHREIGDREEDW